MTSLRIRVPHPVALAGALGLALGLAGCGVKGPLEPPPSAEAPSTQQTAQAQSAQPGQKSNSIGAPQSAPSANSLLGQPTVAASVARGTTSSAVTQAPAAKQSSVLDWLIK